MKKQEIYDEFEHYLKKQADSHKMYPSDFLWQNIQQQLHGTTQWPALTYGALFIIAALIIGTLIVKPEKSLVQPLIQEKIIVAQNTPGKIFTDPISVNAITEKTINDARKEQLVKPVDATLLALADEEKATLTENTLSFSDNHVLNKYLSTDAPMHINNAGDDVENDMALPYYDIAAQTVTLKEDVTAINKADKIDRAATAMDADAMKIVTLPKLKMPRWEIQFYATSSATYRRLIDDNKKDEAYAAFPLNSNYDIDINQAVRHKPSMGMEMGVAVGYRISNSLTLKTGLQFNLREYEIQAYVYQYEPATISFNSNSSVNLMTKYRNYNGSFPVTLKNRYYEISMPIGIEWKRDFTKRFSWGLAATVQPTYVFNKDPFVISTDYKNYTEGTSLLRRININTSMETFLSYKIGNVRWQIGPQFRYQQLPSFTNKYPIREFLFDYGVKIGLTKTIR